MDKALEQLDRFIVSVDQHLSEHYTEADTRVKFIDPILTQVLGYSELSHIRREERYQEQADCRCIDYVISLKQPVLVVEAKRLLKPFEIPTTGNRIKYKLDGVLREWPNAWSAIQQVRAYCDHKGARYAMVTNGTQFIAFKAISERGPWTDGYALVLGSLDVLRQNFTLFHECLSFETIAQDKLSEVALGERVETFRDRPRSGLGTITGGFRNELHDVLHEAFAEVLLDVPDPSSEFLAQCYCRNDDILKYGKQLNTVLVDPLPLFRSPIHPVKPGHRKDPFGQTIQSIMATPRRDPLMVVIGGPGAGKTTFLQWYFKTALPSEAKEQSLVLWCDYRAIECEPEQVHDITLRLVVERLLEASRNYTGTYEQLKEVFRKEIADASTRYWKPFADDLREVEQHIGEFLQGLQTYDAKHLKSLITYLHGHCGKRVIIVLDNMDQKSDSLQNKLYQTAQELVFGCGAIVILVLRESTYLRITRSPSGNAFSPVDFHVKAQPAAIILDKRFNYMADKLNCDDVTFTAASGKTFTVTDFRRFLSLISRSLVSERADPDILESIEAIGNANIRNELKMIYSFLVSGQTKIDEYFWQYTRDKSRRIPFHEFLHSLLHEDRKIFVESRGFNLMNIFDPGPGPCASHFTVLRILQYLKNGGQRGELKPSDYVSPDAIVLEFAEQGIARSDILYHIQRMAEFGLVMPECQEPARLSPVEPFALTRCGLYYLEKMYHQFSYFSSMVGDTIVLDAHLHAYCGDILRRGIAAPKIPIDARLELAEAFTKYLEAEEERELRDGAAGRHPVFRQARFVPRMRQSLELTKKDVSQVRSARDANRTAK